MARLLGVLCIVALLALTFGAPLPDSEGGNKNDAAAERKKTGKETYYDAAENTYHVFIRTAMRETRKIIGATMRDVLCRDSGLPCVENAECVCKHNGHLEAEPSGGLLEDLLRDFALAQ